MDVIRAQLLISSTSAALGTDSNKRARTIGGKAESVAHDANVFELPFSRADDSQPTGFRGTAVGDRHSDRFFVDVESDILDRKCFGGMLGHSRSLRV